jgi:hypothetical protein
MTEFYNEDESGEFISPLFPKTHHIPPFDPSPARADDIALIAEALKLQPGREKMGIGAARQIVALQRDRERRAAAAKKAKTYYAKRKAARRAT